MRKNSFFAQGFIPFLLSEVHSDRTQLNTSMLDVLLVSEYASAFLSETFFQSPLFPRSFP